MRESRVVIIGKYFKTVELPCACEEHRGAGKAGGGLGGKGGDRDGRMEIRNRGKGFVCGISSGLVAQGGDTRIPTKNVDKSDHRVSATVPYKSSPLPYHQCVPAVSSFVVRHSSEQSAAP
jgi:hypothetical protein